jgi:hypothetical protein
MAAVTERQSVKAPPSAAIWMSLAALAAAMLAAAVLAKLGHDRNGIEAALRLTARLGFLLFWLSYVAGPMVTLFGEGWRPLTRHARVLGMSFAGVLTVHLTLVAWICWIGAAPPLQTFVIFGIGAVCAYVLLASSFNMVRRAMGPEIWRRVQSVGASYILFAFAFDFFRPQPLKPLAFLVGYLPFDVLVALAVALRLLAWRKRRQTPPAPRALPS